VAARLQTLAEPGQVVISDSTRRLTGGLFEYRDLGRVALKGLAETVQAWQVLGASAVESRFEAQHGAALTPLVGRKEELELLLRRWERVKAGDGSVVLISGEPGIGKSRLAQTLAERISGEPHIRLRYFCSPHHQDSPLYPSIAQLERAAGFRRDDTDQQRLYKLEAVLAEATANLSEAAPAIADLLSVPTGDRYPPLNPTPQKRKEKTLRTLLAQVEGLAARQPVLMVFEDVHWIDPTSLELLDLLIERVPALSILLIITFRAEFAPPWSGRPHVTLLTLNRLPPRDRAEMIARMMDGTALPRDITDQIIDRTDGVPLFIEELTKAVVESGVLTETGDCHAAVGRVVPLAIPATLQASLLARLDRLPATREVAQIAAALGRQFSHELISAVTPMPHQQIDDALARLVSAELIFRRGGPPDAEYTFKHALVQEAAYSTLLRGQRQQLHARIATTLEEQFRDIVMSQPELLAHHCAEGNMADKAIAYCLAAGEQALARSAMVEAVAQLSKGLNLLISLPDNALRWRHELNLQIALGRALIATKGQGARVVGEAYARARQLCDHLQGPAQLLPVLFGQWVHWLLRGELALARRSSTELQQLGTSQDDASVKFVACRCSGVTGFYLGEFTAACADLEQGLTLFDPARRPFYASLEAYDAHNVILGYLSRVLVSLGYLDQARVRRDAALAEAAKLGHAFTLAHALFLACLDEWSVQSARVLSRHAEELVALSVKHDFALFSAGGGLFRGWCIVALGDRQQGIALLDESLTAWRATGSRLLVPFFLLLLADASGKAGQPVEGLRQLDKVARLIETTQERWVEAEMRRLRGELLAATGNKAAAEETLRQAVDVARHQSAKFWELRATTTLARLWFDRGKRAEAHDLLAPIYGWFTEGFDTPDLKEAKALLDLLQ
jgi:predicted ATPase